MATLDVADKTTIDEVYNESLHTASYKGVEKSSALYKLPYTFFNSCAVVLNDEIHILGGTAGSVFAPYCHYKWDGTKWQHVSTLPYPFYNGSAVVLNNEIHILGGGTTDVTTHSKKHYKWSGTEWVNVSTLPYPFYNGSAVVYNGKIHLMGGSHNTSAYVIHIIYDSETATWSTATKLPFNFYAGCAVVYDDCIYVMGGTPSTTAFRKWDGSAWSTVTVGTSTTAITLPFALKNGTAVVKDGKIHLMGSSNAAGVYYTYYTWDGTTWTQQSDLPYICFHAAAEVYRDEIYLLGGGNSSNVDSQTMMYRLDKDSSTWKQANNIENTDMPYDSYISYYLIKGNRIICNQANTSVSGDVTDVTYNSSTSLYLVNSTGIVNIIPLNEEGKSYTIL